MKKKTLFTAGALALVIIGGAGVSLSKVLATQVHAQAPATIVQPISVNQDATPMVENSQKEITGEIPDSQEKAGEKANGHEDPAGANHQFEGTE